MKMKIFSIVALTVLFGACKKMDAPLKAEAEAFELNQSAAKAKPAPGPINFTAPFAFPEGQVYDDSNDRFLVSSIAMGNIGAVTREGVYSVFIHDADLVSTSGLEIDEAHKRLLVTNTNAEGTVAKLGIYDLKTGARLYMVNLLPLANDAAPHLVNDVAIDQQGNAYVTDSYAGNIYRVDTHGNASLFYHNAAYTPPPGGFGFNGIEYSSSKGGYLLVGHTFKGKIVRIPVDNPAALTTLVAPGITSPDGLLLSKNNKELIVVNNTGGNPGTNNVVSFESKDSWATASNTAQFETGNVYPTTLTSDGKTEYVLYSYLHFLFTNQYREVFTIQPLPFSSNNPL